MATTRVYWDTVRGKELRNDVNGYRGWFRQFLSGFNINEAGSVGIVTLVAALTPKTP